MPPIAVRLSAVARTADVAPPIDISTIVATAGIK
ncbi:unnamed protein product, partial [marine sediment metagenome]